jgi:hypothetical protein
VPAGHLLVRYALLSGRLDVLRRVLLSAWLLSLRAGLPLRTVWVVILELELHRSHDMSLPDSAVLERRAAGLSV